MAGAWDLVRVDEAIAIVGMSCRFPGGVCSPGDLWGLCHQAWMRFRGFRVIEAGVSPAVDPDPDTLGSYLPRHGGFIEDGYEFDADFFGIGPREALAMDPQQRLFLEGAWEAFECEGSIELGSRGARLGCIYWADGLRLWLGRGVRRSVRVSARRSLGGGVASGGWLMCSGWRVLAVSIDTACSSSLVALHLGVSGARGRVFAGARRWCDGDGVAGDVRSPLCVSVGWRRWALQVVCGG